MCEILSHRGVEIPAEKGSAFAEEESFSEKPDSESNKSH
jgi:hypothetical protein